MFVRDDVLGGLEQKIRDLIEEPEESAPPREELEALLEDLPRLGLFGVLTVLPDSPAPDEAIHQEQLDSYRARLLKVLDDAGEAPDLAAAPPFAAVVSRYVEEKGTRLLRRSLENALFEYYDLQDHGLFIDDVGKALDLMRVSTGSHDDIKELFRRLARLSGTTAKFILGLFPEQIGLIHKISMRQAEPHEIDNAFEAFGPLAIHKRLFGVMGTLVEQEVRLRLAINLWARGRGVAITREQILGIASHLELTAVTKLIARLVERSEARRDLLAFIDAHPDVAILERHV